MLRQISLSKLAIHLLSFVPNSAAPERMFSSMGDIKTKKRNRLGVQKLRDTAFVKSEIRREHVANGVARHRLKRHFGNQVEATGTSTQPATQGARIDDEDVIREAQEGLDLESDSEDESESESGTGAVKSFAALMQDAEAAATDSDESEPEEPLEDSSTSHNTPTTPNQVSSLRRVGTSFLNPQVD